MLSPGCLISEEDLARRVGELARQISADYAGKQPLLVGVLKGAFVFLADLVRRLTIPVQCDFVKLSSYGAGTVSTGDVQLHLDTTISPTGRHVLIVEDIVDTGICLHWLCEHLERRKPADVRTCVLLDKPYRRVAPVTVDYRGFEIADLFVVGYGIDWNEQFRELPYIGTISPEGEP